MKKIFITFITIIWGQVVTAQTEIENKNDPSETYSQEFNNNSLSWGVKAGLNYYNLYGKEKDFIFAGSDTKFKPSFHAGIFVNTKMNTHWGLTHELMFSQKRVGVSYKDAMNNDYSSSINRSYIDLIPANINYQVSKFKFYAGPYISILLAASTQKKDENGKFYRDTSIFGDAQNDESKSYYLQKFDFGMNLGLDYQLQNRWSVGLRYSHGFTDLFQNANSSANGNTKKDKISIYNRGFMLSLAYDLTHMNVSK